jgi:hypothetical protein
MYTNTRERRKMNIKKIKVSRTQTHITKYPEIDIRASVAICLRDSKGMDVKIKAIIQDIAEVTSLSLYAALQHSSRSPTPEEKLKKLAEAYSAILNTSL